MSTAPFPVDPVLTGITLAYRNRRFIADDVLPRISPIAKEEFNWNQWNLENGFTLVDTRVGRKSEPNVVEFNATKQTSSTEDYGLDDIIPNTDIDNAAGTVNPVDNAVENLTDLVLLDREIRVSSLVFNAATYPAGNKVVLAGVSQWSDPTSDPIGDIQGGLDVPIVRPNVLTIGRLAWSKLAQHPAIIKAVNRTAGDTGLARQADVQELFELEELNVGESFVNAAKPGQPAVINRVWGKHCALTVKDPLAATPMANRITFGFTVPYGTRVSGSIPEPKMGLRGSQRVRVGEAVKELITAADVGYFLENVVA